MTNHERIQNMSVDEMAAFMRDIVDCVHNPVCEMCKMCYICTDSSAEEWLMTEVDENA